MTSYPTGRRRSHFALAALVAPWALLLLLATVRPLANPDEGRYAEISRWMLMSGDWLTPRLDGLPFFHKPPLLHWLQALSMAVFGVHPWAARLVPALHAGLMLAGLYLAARVFAGEGVARRAALMLGTSLAFLVGGQYVNHDMVVAAWIATAIWAFALAFLHGERPHAGMARLGYAACALGVLAKGLIGLALPGLVLVIWLGWTRQFRKVWALPWVSGLALFAAIALPWFVIEQRAYPGFLDYLFGTQQFSRFTGKSFNNGQPWWFYLVALAGMFFPWVIFAGFEAFSSVKRSYTASINIAKPWVILCWIWLVVIVGFFSIPMSKLVGYVLPVMPPLALVAALGWERALAGRRAGPAAFAGLCVLALGLAVGLTNFATGMNRDRGARDIAETLACAATPDDTIYLLGGYAHDLPFYLQTPRPLVVVQDWPGLRRTERDSWARELFEGGEFEPALATRVLQGADAVAAARARPGQWLVVRNGDADGAWRQGWRPGWLRVARGAGWTLFQSPGTAARAAGSTAERPVTAQQVGLPGCKRQRGEQRQR